MLSCQAAVRQLRLVCVKLLVEGQDVAQKGRAVKQRDAGFVGAEMGPAGERGRLDQPVQHVAAHGGVVADPVAEMRQAGAVPDRRREQGRAVAIMLAAHPRPPFTTIDHPAEFQGVGVVGDADDLVGADADLDRGGRRHVLGVDDQRRGGRPAGAVPEPHADFQHPVDTFDGQRARRRSGWRKGFGRKSRDRGGRSPFRRCRYRLR